VRAVKMANFLRSSGPYNSCTMNQQWEHNIHQKAPSYNLI
jgi:hypothetical protein